MSKYYTYNVEKFKSLFERNFIYIDAFERTVFKYPDKVALIYAQKNKFFTYKEVDLISNKLANALLSSHVKKNDVVLYMLMNCPEFAYIYIATQKIGAISCPIDFRLAAGSVSHIIEECKPSVFFFDDSVLNVVLEAVKLSKYKPKDLILIDRSDINRVSTKMPSEVKTFEDYIKDKSEKPIHLDITRNAYDEVVRLYTSGTTGIQKGIPFNNITEILTAHSIIMTIKYDNSDILMNLSPWFHRGGLYLGGPNPSFYLGATSVAIKYFHPRTSLEYIEKYKVTILIGVPTMFRALISEYKKHSIDLSSLKCVLTMGAPLEKELCLEMINIFTNKIYNACGTTETFLNEILTPLDLPKKAGKTGKPSIEDDVRVVKVYPDKLADPDDLAKMDDVEVGEIAVKTVKGTLDYINNEKELEKRVKGDWFYPGDLATWDNEKTITIKSRKDDMIIVGGNNIYPNQIEEIIKTYPKVAECAIVGAPDKKRGFVIVAYVIKKDESLTINELRKFVNNNKMLSLLEKPRYYIFVNELPSTATGKIQHYKLRENVINDLKNILSN